MTFFFRRRSREDLYENSWEIETCQTCGHIQLNYYKYGLNDLIVMFLGHFRSVFEVLCFGVIFVLLFMF